MLRRTLYRTVLAANGPTLRYLQFLSDSEFDDLEVRIARQGQLLDSLLTWAQRTVPFYHAHVTADRWDRGPLSRLSAFPIVEKADIQRNLDQFVSRSPRPGMRINATGGSTGEPIRFYHDTTYRDWSRAGRLYYDRLTGCDVGDRRVIVWGSERDLLIGRESAGTRLQRWLKGQTHLNGFRMSPARVREYLHTINKRRPVLLLGYVDCLEELARVSLLEDIDVRGAVSAVMSSAGTLDELARKQIELAFGVSVYNRYGCREVGGIAGECSHHGGLHVTMESHVVEIVRPDGTSADEGEMGEVVVTALHNYTMPFIRYRLGDLAALSWKPCGCGRQGPVLTTVEGRTVDVFRRSDGGMVTPVFLRHLVGVIMQRPWVRRYQMIQERLDLVRVRVEITGSSSSVEKGRFEVEVEGALKRAMGESCAVATEFVAEIPGSQSGKFRYAVSNLDTGGQLAH